MNLSPAERKFFDALQAAARRRVRRDVPIAELYEARFGGPDSTVLLPEPRAQHQRIGPTITRVNRKIGPRGLKIVPGVARRSYRLVEID